MNPVDPIAATASLDSIEHATIDDLFMRAALRRPGGYALVDPPNRRTFADGSPRYVTYAAADRMVSAIAGRLHHLGLAPRTVIGLQFPNMVEGVLALLGVLRAGMIAAPLPPLWRRAELVPALSRIGAKAIINAGRIGRDDLCEVAQNVAADLFPIRYVCGFGDKLADGVIALDELFTADRLDPLPKIVRNGIPADEFAIVTWDTTIHGHVPVARNHTQLIAGGVAAMLGGRIETDATFLTAINFASFCGIASGVMPWLLSGGTLALHHAFDSEAFAASCAEHQCDTVVLPGTMATELNEAGLLAQKHLHNVLAVWRTPERLTTSAAWRHASAHLVDVQVFGEIGLIAARRDVSGWPAALSIGRVAARYGDNTIVTAEIARSASGTLALRGPMVPRDPFPLDAAQNDKVNFKTDASGYADTGYPCRVERESGAVVLSGPPAGIVNVGGYRFAQRELKGLIGPAGKQATLTAFPDPYLSHRLVGSAGDRRAVRKTLIENGANALVAGAFRSRRKSRAL